MGCYGPAEAENHVALVWRDIHRKSHMGARLDPTSIALVVALDYLSATKMHVAENRARTAVLPSVAYHEGGTGHQTPSRINGIPNKVRFGVSCAPTRCICHRAHHSTFPSAPCR